MLTNNDAYFGILGQGLSGKTSLAKKIAAGFRRNGVGVIALTLPGDVWAEADWQTTDPDRFDTMFWRCRRVAAFVEFADGGVDKFDPRFLKHNTQGRHLGNRVFSIAQRHTQIPPGIRDQWAAFWLFSCGIKTARTLADEFGDEDIMEAATYPRYRYLFKQRCLPIRRGGPAPTLPGQAVIPAAAPAPALRA